MSLGSKDRFILFPSRANLGYIKQKTVSTTRGYNLLKRKKDTLLIRQKQIIYQIREELAKLPTVMRDAIYSFNRAKFLAVDINFYGLYGSPNADISVKVSYNVVVGIATPIFTVEIAQESSNSTYPLAGLGKGGQQILDIRNKFQQVTIQLVQVAANIYTNKCFVNSIRQINQRINAIEHILLPKLIATHKYIEEELDEFEREEFTRIKKSQNSKAKNLLYAENVKADESLNIKHVLLSFIDPEDFLALRKTLSPESRQTIKTIMNKNLHLEKIVRH